MTARIEPSRVSTGAIAIRDRQQQQQRFTPPMRPSEPTESPPDLPASAAPTHPAHPAPVLDDATIPAQTLFETLLLANRMATPQPHRVQRPDRFTA